MAAAEQELEQATKANITVTVGELLNAQLGLDRLAAAMFRTEMMVKIFQVLEVLEPFKKAASKRQLEVIGKYADEKAPGNWTFKGDGPEEVLKSKQAFEEEWGLVLEEPLGVPLEHVKLAELRAAVLGELGITPGDLRALKWLIQV